MKKIFNIILLLTLCMLIWDLKVSALNKIEEDEKLELYDVNKKVVVTSDNLYDFSKEKEIKKELEKREEIKKLEQEKIEQEKKEQEKIEQRKKQEYLKQQTSSVDEAQVYYNDSSLGNNIASFALQFVGNPYVAGGTSLTLGSDCSGFVMAVYANYNISIPRTTTAQASIGSSISLDNIQKGDIVSYGYNGNITHSAIYIGDGKIVHASTPSLGIRVDNMNIMPIITIRRIV